MGLAPATRVEPAPRLTVVVACRRPVPALGICLEALDTACAGIPAEVVIARAADHPSLPEAIRCCPVREVTAPPGALVPELWGAGLRVARGEIIAFTSTEFRVAPTWAQALLDGLESGVAGVGGPIELGSASSLLERALYFLRYAPFQPSLAEGTPGEIPGDNAAYRGAALRRHAGTMAGGFWEVDFHRRIRAEGDTLRFAGGAVATFRPGARMVERLRERFRHGRYSGGYRVRALGHPWWRGVAATPLVPAVLTARVLRRAARARRLASALTCLPFLVPLASAWALGEAAGALAARAG